MKLRAWGSMFRVTGSGFRVLGYGFRVQGLGVGVVLKPRHIFRVFNVKHVADLQGKTASMHRASRADYCTGNLPAFKVGCWIVARLQPPPPWASNGHPPALNASVVTVCGLRMPDVCQIFSDSQNPLGKRRAAKRSNPYGPSSSCRHCLHAKAQKCGRLRLLGLLAAGTHVFVCHLLAVLLLVGKPIVSHPPRSIRRKCTDQQAEGAAGMYTTRERLLGTVHAMVHVVDGLPALDANHRAQDPWNALSPPPPADCNFRSGYGSGVWTPTNILNHNLTMRS